MKAYNQVEVARTSHPAKVQYCQALQVVLLVLLSIPTLVVSAKAQATSEPLSKSDVIQLLKGSVSAQRVAELAQKRGIDFQLTPDTESQLRAVLRGNGASADASNALITVLRQIDSKPQSSQPTMAPPTLLIESNPAGAQVYIDDEPVGATSSDGRLKLSVLKPGQHRVRLSADGYSDKTQEIALSDGSTLNLQITLQLRSVRSQSYGVDKAASARTSSLPSSGQRVSTGMIRTEDGAAFYKAKCAACHGAMGQGRVGPSLQKTALTQAQITDLLTKGTEGKKAPHNKAVYGLSADQAAAIATCVGTFQKGNLGSNAVDGHDLYRVKCAGCHGPDGSGSNNIGKAMELEDLAAADVQIMSNDDLANVVARGKGKMPAYENKLTDDQIANIVAYIRELRK